ncbi:FMN-dependent NADH-azoreductase [Chryseobacterium sp. RP-3-3]|uniref:FMN dependent NADH:quinone oxidoreductase n=1 Tax=Chryseobacterium antibioticum TaxID=2728847 RepID=A0A7Y0AKH5_9FLAO|nr:NAD(P)H-dependent oxidoreductase [Chryseobacterium antibioticum]NML69038.1 FMN-dependent NADH-azoreductase [Chryseobacterium antibioticum]
MNTLLRIDSSLRLEDSHSRRMGDYFVKQWNIKHPDGAVIQRDTTRQSTPHLTQQTFDAFLDENLFSEDLLLSDQLIGELYQSSEILITCPMYNYGIPSSLKAYFDLVIRTKKTFVSENGIKGLLSDKKAHIISVMGGIHSIPGGMNPLETHLTSILNLMGIRDITYFPLEGTAIPDQLSEKTELLETSIIKHLN